MTEQDQRQTFWEQNRAAAMLAYSNAPHNQDLVVVVASLHDSVGRVLTEKLGDQGVLEVERHIAKVEAKGEIPTSIMIVPRHVMVEILRKTNPRTGNFLYETPLLPGYVWALIVAFEGVAAVQAQVTSVMPGGQA